MLHIHILWTHHFLMNNTTHMTELRVWRQCVYCSCNFDKKTTISRHRMTSVVRDKRQFWSETFTLVQKFSIQLQLPFPVVLWWRETSSKTSYVILSNFPSQAHVKTANYAAPPVHRRRWKKYSNLVLCLSVGYLCHLPTHLSFPPSCFLAMKCPSKAPFDVTTNLVSFHHTSVTNSSAVYALEYYALKNITN